MPDELPEDRIGQIDWILKAPEEQLVSVQIVSIDAPPMTRIHKSVNCSLCSERVMSTRIREMGDQRLCTPCWDKATSDVPIQDSLLLNRRRCQ